MFQLVTLYGDWILNNNIMKEIEKVIKFYVSEDGKEYDSKEKCLEHEKFLKIRLLHYKLNQLNFYKRFKIVPYFHNYQVTNIEPNDKGFYESKNFYYTLVSGRMGNSDDKIRFKIRGNNILLLRYNNDDQEQHYVGKIPKNWLDLTLEELSIEVEKYISNRKVFVKNVSYTPVVTYKEIT